MAEAKVGASAGDPSATLEAVLARFDGHLRSIGARYRLETAELDELAQEVRLRLWRAIGDADRIGALAAAYLYRTATCAAIELVRRRRAERWVPLDSADDSSLALDAHAPAGLELAELRAQVDAAIGALPVARQGVVRMHLAATASSRPRHCSAGPRPGCATSCTVGWPMCAHGSGPRASVTAAGRARRRCSAR